MATTPARSINGTEPHFMKVAARNAFLIFTCSARSGRMGRIIVSNYILDRIVRTSSWFFMAVASLDMERG